MQLTFLRHATLPLANQGRYNGWRDIPIDPKLFDWAKVTHLKEEKFDFIYSSDLIRCTKTIELIFDGRLKSYSTELLREVKFRAEIEGKNFDEIARLNSFNAEYLEDEKSWHRYICEESQFAFNKRLKAFLVTLPPNKNILVCSHAGAIREMLKILNQSTVTLDYLDNITVGSISSNNKELLHVL